VNYGGPAELVDDDVGRVLSAAGKDALIGDLTKALIDAWRNPGEWKRKGERGRLRAKSSYGWDARMDSALELYANLAGVKRAHA